MPQTTCAQRNAARIVLFIAVFALLLSTLAPVRSTSAQQRRRIFKSKLPKQIPLKIRIKKDKEAAALDPTNKNWFRDIEIEVTNTSNKAIHYLALRLHTDLSNEDLLTMTFPLRFGRPDLADAKAKPRPDDVQIKPHATQILTFPSPTHIVSFLDENDKHEWEAWRDKYNKKDPMKLEVYIESLVFGDGSGITTKKELIALPN